MWSIEANNQAEETITIQVCDRGIIEKEYDIRSIGGGVL